MASFTIVVFTQEYPPYLVGGIGTHVRELVSGLAAAGCRVHVFSFSTDHSYVVNDGPIEVTFIKCPFPYLRNQYPQRLFEIDQLNIALVENARAWLKQEHCSQTILHIHDWHLFRAAAQLRLEFNCPIVLTVHGLWSDLAQWYDHPDQSPVYCQEAESCRQADRVIAVSEFLKMRLADLFDLDRARVDVVRNAFDIDKFDNEEAGPGAYSSPEKACKAIVYAGRIVPQKGISALFRSAMQVLARRDDVHYLIVGESGHDGYFNNLLNMVNNHPKLRAAVHFTGMMPRNKLPAIYRRAAMVVVPSLYEPLGYAALEPMSMGKAVIATAAGGLMEVIEGGISGILVPAHKHPNGFMADIDVSRLTSAQLQLLSDANWAVELGRNAQIRIKTHFTPGQMVAKTLSTYDKSLSMAALHSMGQRSNI